MFQNTFSDNATTSGSAFRRLVAAGLRALGYELVRASSRPFPRPIPALHEHVTAALLASRVGGNSAFSCPIDSIVMLNGFGFGPSSWHPFTATLREHVEHGISNYEDSILARFYARWQPTNAAEAIVGFSDLPPGFATTPAHGYHFSPWSGTTLGDELDAVEKYCAADYAEHGFSGLSLATDGFKYHGPVSDALGKAEYTRLIRVLLSLTSRGYDRNHGDINVYLLRRGDDLRFVCRGGVHRLAAAQANDQRWIPARLCSPYLVDIQEAAHWPQVANRYWPRKAAERYSDHLIDFQSLSWAQSQGLAPA